MKIRNVLVAIAIFASPNIHAEFYAKDYPKLKNSDAFKAYVTGLGVAYSWSNAHLSSVNQKPLYCEPKKLGLNSDNYLGILEDGIKRIPDNADLPIEYIFLLQLQVTFPCS
jgi:hypothetical protein